MISHVIDRYDPHFSMVLEILDCILQEEGWTVYHKLSHALDHCQIHNVEVMFTPNMKEARVRLPWEEGKEHSLEIGSLLNRRKSMFLGRILGERDGEVERDEKEEEREAERRYWKNRIDIALMAVCRPPRPRILH